MTRPDPRRWTDAEIAVVREHYPNSGLPAVHSAFDRLGLSPRTDRQIYNKAVGLGLHRNGRMQLRSAPTGQAVMTPVDRQWQDVVREADPDSLLRILSGLQTSMAQALHDLVGYLEHTDAVVTELRSREETAT